MLLGDVIDCIQNILDCTCNVPAPHKAGPRKGAGVCICIYACVCDGYRTKDRDGHQDKINYQKRKMSVSPDGLQEA